MKNEMVIVEGKSGGPVPAYVAYPENDRAPGIVVIHEIWGLNDNTKDIANRFAEEGYLALAPDLFAGTDLAKVVSMDLLREAADPATRDEAQKKMRAALAPIRTPEFGQKTVEKLAATFEYLVRHPNSNGTVGVVGFCFGGTYAFALATQEPNLAFVISFYGQPPQPLEGVATITAPVLAFYGENDVNLLTSLPELSAAMTKHERNFKAIVYPGVGHAFFNDKNPMMYNAEAAAKAWEEVKSFLKAITPRSS